MLLPFNNFPKNNPSFIIYIFPVIKCNNYFNISNALGDKVGDIIIVLDIESIVNDYLEEYKNVFILSNLINNAINLRLYYNSILNFNKLFLNIFVDLAANTYVIIN